MPQRTIAPRGPDRDAALRQYRRRAGVYDRELALFEPMRRLAISKLGLRPGDAALFHFTHDVLQRPEAIANVISHLKPGARVVASGLKWAAPWLMRPINLLVLPAALRSVTSLDGMDQPWRLLQDQLGQMTVESRLRGGAYIASGVCASS
ncbi:MAG: hypothetical protein QG601_376 [Pseudomonadota bacterium]|nr:hypothetical protein [Pseudomonadota bacterium]